MPVTERVDTECSANVQEQPYQNGEWDECVENYSVVTKEKLQYFEAEIRPAYVS